MTENDARLGNGTDHCSSDMERTEAQDKFENEVQIGQTINVQISTIGGESDIMGKVVHYADQMEGDDRTPLLRNASIAVGPEPETHWTIYDSTGSEGLRIKLEEYDRLTDEVRVEEEYEVRGLETFGGQDE